MTATLQTPRTTVKRLPKRGAYDRATIDAIVDEALICHVGFVVDGQPVVIPTIHWRGGEQLYFHGSAASRMLRSLKGGVDACVTVTLLDGLVLARSAFHHSMNYRSLREGPRGHRSRRAPRGAGLPRRARVCGPHPGRPPAERPRACPDFSPRPPAHRGQCEDPNGRAGGR